VRPVDFVGLRKINVLDPEKLVQNNILKAMSTMNALSSIGVNPSGFSKLLCSRFYAQIVRPQMKYDIAINCFNHTQLKTLEEAQNKYIRKIYGASGKISTKVMLYLDKLPTMKERIAILQAQFLFRSLSLPEDTLLYLLMPHIQYTSGHQWYRLSKTALWRLMPPTIADLDARGFRTIEKKFLHSNLEKQIQSKNSKLLSSCRPTITLDPILWLPMTHEEVDVYAGALVDYQVGPPNPAPVILTITCQDDTPSVASTRIAGSVYLKQ
jgi:hypothetical protein